MIFYTKKTRPCFCLCIFEIGELCDNLTMQHLCSCSICVLITCVVESTVED